MSSCFFQRFNYFVRTYLAADNRFLIPDNTHGELTMRAYFASALVVGHGLYVGITSTYDDPVVIKQKYTMVCRGFTHFMVEDTAGRHFDVNNSCWYFHWTAVELWNSLQPGEAYRIQRYGVRIPLFGVFPIVVSAHVSKKKN